MFGTPRRFSTRSEGRGNKMTPFDISQANAFTFGTMLKLAAHVQELLEVGASLEASINDGPLSEQEREVYQRSAEALNFQFADIANTLERFGVSF